MRIVSIGVCGPNEKYLEKNIKHRLSLADDVLIVGNNTSPEDEKIIKDLGCWFYRDDREWGKAQPLIKTDLLKRAGRLKPDWIMALDMDEFYDSKFTREEAEKLAAKGGIGYYFYIVNLWNDEKHYRRSMSFWNIRYYRFAPEHGLEFQRKALHCGLAPPIVYHYGNYAPFLLLHYGLMDEEDRMKKVERYNKYDPNAVYKDKSYYDALEQQMIGAVFDEKEVHIKVVETVKDYKHKTIKGNMAERKFVYVRRTKDGVLFDIPDKLLASHLKRKNTDGTPAFEMVGEINLETEATISTANLPVVDEFECPLCGVKCNGEEELAKHKKAKHA